jgi:Tetratricopeptide repeat
VRLERGWGKRDELINWYLQQVLKTNPDQADLSMELAWVQVMGPTKLRDATKALPLARRAVALAPDEPLCLNTLGVVYYRLGQWKEAADTLQASAQTNPEGPSAYDLFFLAMAYGQTGQPAKAKDCYDQAVRWCGAHGKFAHDQLAELLAIRAEAEGLLGLSAGERPTAEQATLRTDNRLSLPAGGADTNKGPIPTAGVADANKAAVLPADRAAVRPSGLVIDEVKILGADHPTTVATTLKLGGAYVAGGRTREAIPHLATAHAANPRDTLLSLKVAALQAWFGQEKELAATRQRVLAFAKDTNDANKAERAAKVCSILPYTDKVQLEAALALARKGVELGKGGEWWEWRLLALGMAEYRSGNDGVAQEALLAAVAAAGESNRYVTGTSAFFRAMSLFRQRKPDEARRVAIAAAAKMKPLPKDENNPLAGGVNARDYQDDLILWLAYKEAKALIRFDAGTPPKAETDKN